MLLVILDATSYGDFSPPYQLLFLSPPFFGKIQVLLRKYLYLWHILGTSSYITFTNKKAPSLELLLKERNNSYHLLPWSFVLNKSHEF